MPKTYHVFQHIDGMLRITVTANSEKEALEKAMHPSNSGAWKIDYDTIHSTDNPMEVEETN